MLSVTIEGKTIGQRKPLFAEWSVSLPSEWNSGQITLREFIQRVVEEEVKGFQERQEERRLTRALSKEAIEQGAAQGKIDMGGRELDQEVDLQEAINTALLAFEDGLYYVFIDEQQVEQLDDALTLRQDSRAMFLRLVALAGG